MKTKFLFSVRVALLCLVILMVMAFVSSLEEVSPPIVPSSGQSWHSIETTIDELAKNFVNEDKIPGMTVAISKNGRLIFNKAYGYADFSEKKQMKTSHRTKIGSVSKVLTTLGVMKLTEEKPSFTVDRLVYGPNGIFDDWRDYDTQNAIGKPEWYAKIRIKHLLSHTSGFKGSGNPEGASEEFDVDEEDLTYKQIHQYFLKSAGLFYEPGTDSEYSNHGLGFSGHIMSEVSRMSYEKYVTNKILDPIGLKGKISPYYSSDKSAISSLHSLDDNGNIKKISHSNSTSSTGLAAGGWTATAKDMVRLMVATDKLSNYSDVLKANTIDLMETKPFPAVGNSHALGWGMVSQGNKAKKLGHGGVTGGGTAYVCKFIGDYKIQNIDLSDINVAICTNRKLSSTPLANFANEIAVIVGKATINSAYDLFPETLAKHGISEGKYQEVVDQLAPNGSMPAWIDFFEAENKVLVNAIFEPAKKRRWLARHNLSGEKYQEVFDKYVKEAGYRLTQIDTYTKNGQILYACIMVKEDGPQQYRYHGISEKTHQERFDELKSKDYAPVLISVASIDGKRYYTATYEKKNVGSWEARSQLTSDEYQKKFEENRDAGRKLAYLNAYAHKGKIFYSAIWQSEAKYSYVARHDLSSAGYQDAFEKWRDAGYWVEIVTAACDSSGKSVFAALWTK